VVLGVPVGNGGANRSTLSHEITQRQLAQNAEAGEQDQGAFSSGEGGNKEQLSTGVSQGTATQDMLQLQIAAPGSPPDLFQDQDTGDPRCCWDQLGNDANSADIAQTTAQDASSDFASQTYYLQANCFSQGTCHATQSAFVDGEEDASAECPDPESEVDNACFLVTTNADT
jgi:hypothetical protein